MGVQFPGKKRYVTLEWPLRGNEHGKAIGALQKFRYVAGVH